MSLPDSVVELGGKCFHRCKSLRSFGASSNLERVCAWAFAETGLDSFFVPDSVVELGNRCLYQCRNLRRVTFGAPSQLERICSDAFSEMRIESLSIPDNDGQCC